MTAKSSSSPDKKSQIGDYLFAIFHLVVLLAIFIYAVVALIQGNAPRFAIIIGCLVIYYFLVLHKPLLKEIDRKRKMKSGMTPKEVLKK